MYFSNEDFGRRYYRRYYRGSEYDITADADLTGEKSSQHCDEDTERKERKKRVCFHDDMNNYASIPDAGSSGGVTPDGSLEYDDHLPRAKDIQNRVLVAEVKKVVAVLLSGHDKTTQKMFRMYYGENLTLKQISEEVGLSIPTVFRRIKTTMKQVKEIVKRKGLEYQNYTRF